MNLDKLKGKLVEKNKTYDDCAHVLSISVTSFSQKMNGKSPFKVPEINILSKFLELTNDEKIQIFLN